MRLLSRSSDLRRFDEIADCVRQHFGFPPTPSQVLTAGALLDRTVVELDTGQGKTIAGAMAAIRLARQGRSVWISTTNDYLARRDAAWMAPLYESQQVRVGVVSEGASQAERRRQYDAEVVYGTLREFGFDFLRGRLAERRNSPHLAALGGRDPFQSALIVDEADSLLIDEATIPLILSVASPTEDAVAAALQWAAAEAPHYLAGKDYEQPPGKSAVTLTVSGREKFLTRPMPVGCDALSQNDLIEALERAILINERYVRDRDYVLRDGRVRIVDEFTGRVAEGRSWGAGIHQAVEAREGVPLTAPGQTGGRITVQEFVSRFQHVSGMTGTAAESAREFQDVYGLGVQVVPPHQPARRAELPAAVVATPDLHRNAVADEAAMMIGAGRAVLIGTRTVGASEQLSAVFRSRGVEHVVLNARYPEREAEVIAAAGQPGRVTIATNMAGRGTDIRLADSVRSAGGLHVIITELNSASRIDRQLIGRCGRQGDPGTFRFLLSGEDSLLAQAFPDAAGDRLSPPSLARLRQAQQVIERRQFEARQLLRLRAARRQEDMRVLGLDPVLDPLED